MRERGQQHCQLRRGQRDLAVAGRRPNEPTLLQTLREQACPLLAPLSLGPMARQWLTHQMILIRSPCRPRNTNIWPPLGECYTFTCRATAERILLRHLLGLGRQRRKTLAHVRHPSRPVARQACLHAERGARSARSSEPGSSRQATDQLGKRLGVIVSALDGGHYGVMCGSADEAALDG